MVVLLAGLTWASASAQEIETPTPTGLIRFAENIKPEAVAWVADGPADPVTVRLKGETREAVLPPGAGCLVLLRSGYLPIVTLTEIEGGEDRVISDLGWKEGPRFFGSAADSEGLPLPAEIRFREEPAPAGDREKLCHTGLAALGFFETQASSSGQFESQSLPVGRYVVTLEAPDHASVEHLLAISGESTEYDLGTVTLTAIARVEVSVDVTEIDEDPPFELTVEIERPNEILQAKRWKPVFETEITADAPVALESQPGLHRLILRKDGGSLVFVTEEEYSTGWQETVLHPEPIFVTGTVTVEGLPSKEATLKFVSDGIETDTVSDESGDYELSLWTPAHYGALVRTPEGSTTFEPVDLRETKPGETVEHDFDLSMTSISGRVVASADKAPIEGCGVVLRQKLSDGESLWRTKTAADGTFSFAGIKEAETVSLVATTDGYLPKEMDLAFGGESIRDLWIELERTKAIRGRVVGASGEPVPGAEIVCSAMAMFHGYSSRAISEQDGTFELEASPGVVLYASTPGYTLGWAVAPEGGETVIRLEPLRATTRVLIQTEDGDPAQGVSLMYVSDAGVSVPHDLVFQNSIMNGLDTVTDAEGVIRVGSLPSGVYQVVIGLQSGLSTLGTLPIPSSGDVTLRIPAFKRTGEDQTLASLAGRADQ
jgi:hypothetical protein